MENRKTQSCTHIRRRIPISRTLRFKQANNSPRTKSTSSTQHCSLQWDWGVSRSHNMAISVISLIPQFGFRMLFMKEIRVHNRWMFTCVAPASDSSFVFISFRVIALFSARPRPHIASFSLLQVYAFKP